MQTENEYLYENYDNNWQRLYFDADSQGFVVAHKGHGKDELPLNLAVATRLAKHFGEKIELLPCIYGDHLRSADANRNDETWELKTTNASYSSVQKRLRVGSHQCGRILLVLPDTFENSDVLRAVISAVNSDKNNRIIQIALLLSNNKLVTFTKGQVRRRDFVAFYEALLG